jgi:prevent-host-death family protein
MRIDVAEAEAQLPELLEQAEQGEEVVITRDGEPVVRLQRLQEPSRERSFGDLRGKVRLPGTSNKSRVGAGAKK